MGSTVDESDMDLHIASYTGDQATVIVSAPNWDGGSTFGPITVTVANTETAIVPIPRELRLIGTEKQSKAIIITATADVVVFALNNQTESCGGYMAHPVDSLGTNYYAMAWWPAPRSNNFAQIAVASTDDANLITFTFPPNRGISVVYSGHAYTSDEQLIVRIEQNQVIQLQEMNFADLSGTQIEAIKPIAVFSGNTLTNVNSRDSVDMVIEQLPNVNTWGERFVIAPIPGRRVGDVIKVVAMEENTKISLSSGEVIELLTKGDHDNINIPSESITQVVSDKPILLAQFVGSTEGNDVGQPSMMIMPPMQQYLGFYRFIVPNYFQDSFLLLVAERDIVSGFVLDGEAISTTGWNSLTDSVSTSIRIKTISLRSGSHVVIHSNDEPFGAFIYGVAQNRCSYTYAAGQCLESLVVCMIWLSSYIIFGLKFIGLFV